MSGHAGPPVPDASREALREHAEDLLAYLQRRAASREDAADLLGETLLQAWRRIDTLPEGRERQRMWLFTIAAKVLANYRRSRGRKAALADRLRDHLGSAEAAPDPAETLAVRDAVLRLHAAQRELIMLVHWDGFTVLEASEFLQMKPSTARSRYAAARASLRAALTEEPHLTNHK